MNVTEPGIGPVTDGENVTATVHDAPDPRIIPQGVTPLPTTWKSALATKLLMFTAAALTFVTVTVFAGEVSPSTPETAS
jgi:hypothetical protein